MKFILKFLPVFLATILPLASCTEDPEDAMGTIVGFVTQAPAGTEPISGVTVSILSTGQSTTTGSNGAFTFINMQPGSYSLQFSKAGYNTNSRTVTVVAGNENQCDVQMSKVNEEAEIVINPSSLNFGTTQTDMSVTIKNNGNATASWSLELGNNSWLSASQVGGSIQAGRTQSITFSVDRNYLSETRTVVVNLQAFGNSYPITVSCSPRNTTSHMVIEPTSLNFGSESTHQTFTIRNTGTSTLSWNASALTANGLSLSAMQGTVSAGGSSVVVATVDRTVITGELVTTFIISDGVKDQTVTVNINKGAGTDPDDPENPGTGDDPNKMVVK
ncbi:MAG: carboxypeptidase regulatory-like domain-containing protein, partial [Duncaniella sp.]|nr:carboxypeptidase regulatory-like domain-containing protein [Duncaniella sp.]